MAQRVTSTRAQEVFVPKIVELYGMKFYVNTREAANERPHVHVSQGKGRANDLKIWLDTCTVAKRRGTFSEASRKKAISIVRSLLPLMHAEWEAVHGKSKRRK